LVYALLDQPTLDKEAIFALHRAVQTHSVVDMYCPIGAWKNESNGRYITQDNRPVYLAYPEPEAIEHLMSLWLDLYHQQPPIQSEAEAVLVYTRLHLAFASIHPFFDGNGRMARLLANIPLLKSGYLPIVVKKEARAAYIQTLSEYQRISQTLTQTTTQLLSEGMAFNCVQAFFAEQYQVTQTLLSEMKHIINPTS
jgi:Fic family protein